LIDDMILVKRRGFMSFIEREVFPALSRAVNFVLETFDSRNDRDLEGLSMRALLINELADHKLCNIDISYGKKISIDEEEDIVEWMNSYIEKIDGDLEKLLANYALILENKAYPETHLRPRQKKDIDGSKKNLRQFGF